MTDVSTGMIHRLVPFAGFLGVEVVEASPERVVMSLAARPELGMSGGGVHGGAVMALADVTAAVMAVVAGGDLGTASATAESSTHLLEHARGALTATATVLRRGRSTVVDVVVTDGAGTVAAVVRQTVAVRVPSPRA